MNNPTISVIVPIYNSEKYLSLCIESILHQSYSDFELLLINDGSPDNCGKICDDYAVKDLRIRVFHFDNAGALKARVKGIENANGKYICFVDSDDTIPTNSLSLLIEKALKYELDITIGTWYRILDRYPKRIIPLNKSGILNSFEFVKSLINEEIYTGPVGRLFKRTLFSDRLFETPFRIINNEDLIMNIKFSNTAHNIGVFDDIVVYNYFDRPQSASKVKDDLKYWLKFYNYLTTIIEAEHQNELKEELARFKLRSIYYKITQELIILDYANAELKMIVDEASTSQISPSELIMIYALKKKYLYPIFNLLYNISMFPQKIVKLKAIIDEKLSRK